MNRLLALAFTVLLVTSAPASGDDLDIISGGAVEPGVTAVVALFRAQTGIDVKVRFATAPMILQRVASGEAADVVIAPPAVIDQLERTGKLDGRRTAVGRVGVGVVVRDGAPVPDVSSEEALRRALRDARSVVYNKASTGLYLEKLFERLGVGAEVKAKEVRYPDGASVIEHVIRGTGNDIGFGAITEITAYRGKGARLVGPLPAATQNYTSYAAAAAMRPQNAKAAAAFLKYIGSPAARATLLAQGVE
ncbi:MAG: substrate-binding domain-containing protein [Bradyrhizobiaceae bacterium]|nr:substrate-binding domain-containing protein [Bradyrhizobiaceae bacterium]